MINRLLDLMTAEPVSTATNAHEQMDRLMLENEMSGLDMLAEAAGGQMRSSEWFQPSPLDPTAWGEIRPESALEWLTPMPYVGGMAKMMGPGGKNIAKFLKAAIKRKGRISKASQKTSKSISNLEKANLEGFLDSKYARQIEKERDRMTSVGLKDYYKKEVDEILDVAFPHRVKGPLSSGKSREQAEELLGITPKAVGREMPSLKELVRRAQKPGFKGPPMPAVPLHWGLNPKEIKKFRLLQQQEDKFATESMNLRELIRALSKYNKEGYMTPSNFPLQKYTPKK